MANSPVLTSETGGASMAAVPTLGQVHEMVMQAMRDRAPAMYCELLANGEFDRVVDERVDLFDRTCSQLSSAATYKTLSANLPFEDGVRALEQAALRGATMLELSENTFGHNLTALLNAAVSEHLKTSVALSDEQQSEIAKATTYYNGKLFEYPAVGEAMKYYPSLPKLPLLIEAATSLIDALQKPCTEAT
jgi:hypothetical protein